MVKIPRFLRHLDQEFGIAAELMRVEYNTPDITFGARYDSSPITISR